MIRTIAALLVLLLAVAPARAQVAEAVRVEADGTRTLTHALIVPGPVDAVWNAVASVEGWQSWAVPRAWADPSDPAAFETSYSLAAARGDPGNVANRFVAALPRRILVFRTTRTPEGFPHAEAYLGVVSFFELEPVDGDHTRVRLSGTNYPAGPAGDALLAFFMPGNRQSLEALRDRFAKGPVDWPARLARPAH